MSVVKRNGKQVKFNFSKIKSGVVRAAKDVGGSVSNEDLKSLQSKFDPDADYTVDRISDIVEEWLMGMGLHRVLKSYILYKEEHKKARFVKDRLAYISKYVNSGENASTSSETDANANVLLKNVANLEGEVYKMQNRQMQREHMFNQLTLMYPEVAKQYEQDLDSHIMYAHDESCSSVPKPYCMAASLFPLHNEGVGNIDGVTPYPPNDIKSYSGQVTNLVFSLSSQIKGAVAISEYLIMYNYYIIQEFGEQWYEHLDDVVSTGVSRKTETVRSRIHDGFKQFIWGINQPAGNRSYQSPFTNVSYFDHTYFESLFGEFRYNDGSAPEWKAIDTLQRMFMKFFNKLRTTAVLTFPVEAFAMVYDKETGDIIDKDYKDLCAEMYAEGHSFFTYISDSADSLSSCCFSKDTKVLWKRTVDSDAEVSEFSELFNLGLERIFVFNEGKWNPAKCIRLKPRQMYKVVLDDETSYIMTDNHINVTANGEKKTSELIVGDRLKFFIFESTETRYKSIAHVDKVEYHDEFVYCVECDNKDNPYFTLASGLVTHNCRLKNEVKENTFNPTSGLTGVMTGSCNVITLNINRIVQNWYREIRTAITVDYIPSKEQIAVEFHDSTSAWVRSLRQYICNILDRVYKYHIAYKTILYDLEDKKMYASSNAGYIYLKKLYSTVGINGLNEAARFFGLQVSNNEPYINFLQFILGTIKEQNKLYSIHDKKRPFVFNSEVVPAEGLGAKNYNWDKEDGYWVPEDENLYNSYFYNAHDPNTTVLDKFILHGRKTFQYTDGGSALHCNLDSHLSKEQYLKLIDFAIKNGTSYFTFNVPNTKCNDCGHIVKLPVHECPKCGSQNLTQYTRVIGYLRPVTSFGKDRQIEAAKRVYSDGAAELQKTEE